jgi:hypothetical protein
MRPLLASLLLLGSVARAADPDPASLYVLSTEGSTTSLRAGQPGTFVLSIRTVPGAHVSDEAPLKLLLAGSGGVQPAKATLGRADAKAVQKGSGPADPRFEVPFSVAGKGPGVLEAKLTFFVCTDTLCSRQQKTLNVPVTVE